LMYFPQM